MVSWRRKQQMMTEEIKKNLEKPEYDFLKTNPHLGENIILLGLGGSHAYGTNVEGSDIDIRGIAVNSKREILLGRDFEQVIDNETDTMIYSLLKVIGLLANANPNILEMLFLKPEHYIKLSEAGKLLVENRHLFLSQKCFYTFGGYARQQLRRINSQLRNKTSQVEKERYILNAMEDSGVIYSDKYSSIKDNDIKLYIDKSSRKELEEEIFVDINLKHYPLRDYNGMFQELREVIKDYDKVGKRASYAILHGRINKHAMHLVRLLKTCITILETGDFCTYCEKDHDLLMDIRNGKYLGEDGKMLPEFFEMIDKLEKDMSNAFLNTQLPKVPDLNKISDLVYAINEKVCE